ncbi:unnamed protein product [Echinostoma caproni]|uniref:Uncharacterized protein n=1 Tax=Echinostoma caproni TaxID=27848 RepID=A0A183AUM9_9TREM|nr:unnamed protein product [Echinostoma caproni]
MSSAKPNGQSIGTISFSTKNDEDISGLDEAMETFRISASNNVTQTAKSSAGPTIETEPLNNQPLGEGDGSVSDFEVAVEATAVPEDSAADNASSILMADDVADLTAVEHRATDSDTCFPAPEFSQSAQTDDSSAGFAPLIKPSIRLRPCSEKSNLVAASDIHALLDSFAPTRTTPGIGGATQVYSSLEPRDASPDLASTASIREDKAPYKERPSFEIDTEAGDEYHMDPVTRPDHRDLSPSHADSKDDDSDEIISTQRRSQITVENNDSTPTSPGIHAPPAREFQTRIPGKRSRRTRSTSTVWAKDLEPVIPVLGHHFVPYSV